MKDASTGILLNQANIRKELSFLPLGVLPTKRRSYTLRHFLEDKTLIFLL